MKGDEAVTRTIQSELKRTGLSKEKERRPSSFIDHAVEANYIHDIVDKKSMIFKRPKKEKRYRIRKGGEVRHVKIRASTVDTTTIGFRVLLVLEQADAPILTKEVQGALPNINPKTVSAYLTWYAQTGIVEKVGSAHHSIRWRLVDKDKPLAMQYAEFLGLQRDRKRVTQKKLDEAIPATDALLGLMKEVASEDVAKSTLKDVLLDLKKLFEDGITVRIKVSLE